MGCPRCGRDNPASARFCMECGAGLRRGCGRCGAKLPAEAGFCPACGQEGAAPERDVREYTPTHLAEKILQSRSALEGERKQVTVLFADRQGLDVAAGRHRRGALARNHGPLPPGAGRHRSCRSRPRPSSTRFVSRARVRAPPGDPGAGRGCRFGTRNAKVSNTTSAAGGVFLGRPLGKRDANRPAISKKRTTSPRLR
jgi:hypothetical protein